MATSSAANGVFKSRIVNKLQAALVPTRLSVVDVSHMHAGHAGVKDVQGGETHFNIEVVSDAFAGQSLIKRQRTVYQILADELAERVHALSMKTKTPEEDSKNKA